MVKRKRYTWLLCLYNKTWKSLSIHKEKTNPGIYPCWTNEKYVYSISTTKLKNKMKKKGETIREIKTQANLLNFFSTNEPNIRMSAGKKPV